MVVLTTVVTPVLLKFAFADRANDPDVYTESDLVDDYSETEELEKKSHQIFGESKKESRAS